jgi:hypothetical protein
MTDIAFNEGDLYITNNDFAIISNSEALVSQLYIFLNIRACHKDGSGNIVFPGELEYDQNQGIDFTYVFDSSTTENQIRNHYRQKILAYYGDYITEITSMTVDKDNSTREITLEFTYKTIYSSTEQTFILS